MVRRNTVVAAAAEGERVEEEVAEVAVAVEVVAEDEEVEVALAVEVVAAEVVEAAVLLDSFILCKILATAW